MKTQDFYYRLPEEQIAQTPIEPRHDARLLVYDRKTGEISHKIFKEIGEYFNKNDLIVINQTKVLPARIFAQKSSGGKAEILLLRQVEDQVWECLVGGKRITAGKILSLKNGPDVEILAELEGSKRLIRFTESVEPYLNQIGEMPLPPYIHETLQDPDRYQTVYAKHIGSAAAPTAGLHFTPELINSLKEKGIRFCEVTLHVGLDTFAPVMEDDPEEHKIHTEWCELTPENAAMINQTAKDGGRIIAVGTTSVRTLESAARIAKKSDRVAPISGPTDLFILPGYQFKAVDLMITNFHLPKSTLLMLVSAFAGRENILNIYKTAIDKGYRFFSFGDTTLII
ncbi:MAG: tRNA preQ1(34) S-adenosylmethionine ribosyltransferase-isomerase QueA [Anaerolineaceae bacterium]|nr:tRNA preQ1(34) S-adenosylmethionine ribosyltransferase-isomerase QueA [Anaerolineaceae bacterium]